MLNDIKYTKKDDVFYYTCPYCGYVHKIDKLFWIYDELKQLKLVQDTCFHCDEMLYMEYNQVTDEDRKRTKEKEKEYKKVKKENKTIQNTVKASYLF